MIRLLIAPSSVAFKTSRLDMSCASEVQDHHVVSDKAGFHLQVLFAQIISVLDWWNMDLGSIVLR